MDLDIAKPLRLKCGLKLPNRLVKAATAEQIAQIGQYTPNIYHETIYGQWAKGGWGMIIAGNVFVDSRFLSGPNDVAIPKESSTDTNRSWKRWVETSSSHGTPIILQLNHAGKQSSWDTELKRFPRQSPAPSAIPLNTGDSILQQALRVVVYGKPKEMTIAEIESVVSDFADAARFAACCGFSGIEIHAGYSHLLSQFLTRDHNSRNDDYGGSAQKRARIVVEIVEAIRAVVPLSFCVGLKLTSGDHRSPGKLRDCVLQLKLINDAGIDFFDLSGGNVEGHKPAKGTFFQQFLTTIRQSLPNTPLVITGGLRSRRGMESAVHEGICDMVGVGRPAILEPDMPVSKILNTRVSDEDAIVQTKSIKARYFQSASGFDKTGLTGENAWYTDRMHKLAGCD